MAKSNSQKLIQICAITLLLSLNFCGGGGSGGNNNNPTSYACNNSQDDDGDGLVDMADPGCSSPNDNDEYNVPSGNKKPVVNAAFADVSIPEDGATSVALAGHFTDPEGKTLTYTTSGFGPEVHADVNGNNIDVFSEPDYNGTKTGEAKACDPQGLCAVAPLKTIFTPVNDAPELNAAPIMTTSKEGAYLDGKLDVSDVDGDALTCGKTSNGGLTELVVNADCTITSTAAIPYGKAGSYTFSAWVNDGKGGVTQRDVTLNVADKNQVLVITGVTLDQNPIQEGGLLTGAVSRTDGDGDYTTCSLVSSTLSQARVTSAGLVYSCTAEPCDSLTPQALPQGTAGDHTLEVRCCDPFECGTNYVKSFHVQNTWGANDLPYQFDSTKSSQPSDITTGYSKSAWEDIYAANPDVRAIFSKDELNDMDLTMTRLDNGNLADWEWSGALNVVTLSADTIYFKILNPSTSQTEWRGEYIGTTGVDLIKSK